MSALHSCAACTHEQSSHVEGRGRCHEPSCLCDGFIDPSICLLNNQMTAEELRAKLLKMADDGLSHSWLVTGENRDMLQAGKAYLLEMFPAELDKIIAHLPAKGVLAEATPISLQEQITVLSVEIESLRQRMNEITQAQIKFDTQS